MKFHAKKLSGLIKSETTFHVFLQREHTPTHD